MMTEVKNKMVTFTQEEKDFLHDLMKEFDEENDEESDEE